MKKRICLLVSVIAFFAMTAASFAANTANINVTSEPITYHALCDKAGGLTLTFDNNTEFRAGDQVTADLPLNVSLCNDIDFVIGLHRGGMDPDPYDDTFVLPAIGTDDAGPVTGDGTLTSANGGVAFWVHGSKGSQRVYIDILSDVDDDGVLESDTTATLLFVGTALTDKLAIELLDQQTYTTDSGIFTDNNLTVSPSSDTTDYDDVCIAAQNTLCINVSEYDNEYVKLSFDSKADKYTWIPSDPQVAHVVAAQQIAFAPCAKRVCGNILEPTAGTQGVDDTCLVINNEGGINSTGTGYATAIDGYCPSTHRNNRLIIQETSGTPFAAGLYQVKLEILVDGVGGDQGAYFAGQIGTATFSTSSDACAYDEASTSQSTVLYDANNFSNVYAIDASGTNTSLAFGSDTDCAVGANNRITKVKTTEISLFNGTDEDFLWVDIPNIIWDKTLFTNGEKLSVKVTLMKSPCGTIFEGEWCVGTLGCEVDSDKCFEYSRVFPYFGKKGNFVNYLSLTNTSSVAVTYKVEIYEKDGDQFTASIPVGAQSLEVKDLHSLTVTTVKNTGGGTFGDEKAYAIVKGSQYYHGSAFMINSTSGQAFDSGPSDITSAEVDCP